MAWEFEALHLEDAENKGVINRNRDGEFLQRYYNDDLKKSPRYIIAGREVGSGHWIGVASAYSQGDAEWVVDALNIAGPNLTRLFPRYRK
jgi:hypothetical protein